MYLARQYTRLQQFVGGVEVEIIGGNDAADLGVEVGLNHPVNHAQLVSQLAFGAGLVKHSECLFPEPAANGKDRIVLREVGDVVLAVADAGARKMARDFAEVLLHHRFDRLNAVGTLGQDHLTNDRFDVGVGQFDTDREPAFESFEVGCAGDCGLAGADEQQFAADVFAASLDRFLNVHRPLRVAADELLDFVENNQCQGKQIVLG